MKILVTGGAGYIGSHMVKYLAQRGCSVTVIDDLSTGNRDAVKNCTFVQGDFGDKQVTDSIFSKSKFEAVIHFAAFSQVAESTDQPLSYYYNNVSKTISLLRSMDQAGINYLVFSSSASVYGNPQDCPTPESAPLNPINPYGVSKCMTEKIVEDCSSASDLNAVMFRYFNAAGADPSGELGESHEPETHLIPIVLQAASGLREGIEIYGSDYDTPDGTCIRDFIHVWDLCEAHWLGLLRILKKKNTSTYNLGNGVGFSVKEVINSAEKITGKKVKKNVSARRSGDPARLVADSSLAQKELGWKPTRSSLNEIIEDAWAWQKKIRTTTQ